jgi:hypothetical protein
MVFSPIHHARALQQSCTLGALSGLSSSRPLLEHSKGHSSRSRSSAELEICPQKHNKGSSILCSRRFGTPRCHETEPHCMRCHGTLMGGRSRCRIGEVPTGSPSSWIEIVHVFTSVLVIPTRGGRNSCQACHFCSHFCSIPTRACAKCNTVKVGLQLVHLQPSQHILSDLAAACNPATGLQRPSSSATAHSSANKPLCNLSSDPSRPLTAPLVALWVHQTSGRRSRSL